MAMLAERLERTVEERIARLEGHFEHIQSDITEVKSNICRLEQRIETRFEKLDQKFEKIDQRFEGFDERFENFHQRLDALKDSQFELRLSMERSFSKITMWGLTLYIALAASLLGVMAKGFGWIH